MFEELQNGTNTVMNIKCDFVGCENADSIFCSTREKANETLFERGWVVDSRKWKHFCKDHAVQHRVQADEGYCAENCIDDPNKIGWVFCPYCGKRLRR